MFDKHTLFVHYLDREGKDRHNLFNKEWDMVKLYKRSLYMRARKIHHFIKLSEGFLKAVDRLLAVRLFS